MSNSLAINYEKAVRFLVEHFPVTIKTSKKPILFHTIRVGVYLYENGYTEDVVLAGFLHDVIEWSNATEKMVKEAFGDNVLRLILANTKDDSIMDKYEKTTELIKRCVSNGQDALIIKTADILDSFKWYSQQDDNDGLEYCMRNVTAIFKFKPDNFSDKVFEELATQNYSSQNQ